MHKVFVTYRLKPGVAMEDYKAWSSQVDQRITAGQPGLIRFEVYAVKNADSSSSSVDVVEDIEVEDFDAWMENTRKPGMAYVMETIGEYVDLSTLQIVHGTRIVSSLPADSRPPLPGKST